MMIFANYLILTVFLLNVLPRTLITEAAEESVDWISNNGDFQIILSTSFTTHELLCRLSRKVS